MEERATGAAHRENRLLRITWVKSGIGYRQSQRLTIKSLGLRKLNQTVEHYDSPSIRGMLNKVHHLVRVEELDAAATRAPRETGTQRFAARLQAKAAAREALLAELAELETGARRPAPAATTSPARPTGAIRSTADTGALEDAAAGVGGARAGAAATVVETGEAPAVDAEDQALSAVTTDASFVEPDPVVTASEALAEAAEEARAESDEPVVTFRPQSQQ